MTSFKPDILLTIKRGPYTERVHSGFITLVDKDLKTSVNIGNSKDNLILLRSCAKPFQALPLLSSGAFQKYNLNLKHLAVCCGSHSGSHEHTETVKDILTRINLDEKSLKCGIHPPLDKETRHDLIKNNLLPTELHNNCSGKHAGMLAVCKNNNWDIETYLDYNHPLQLEILDLTKKLCLFSEETSGTLDGCGTPIYGFPLKNIGIGYLNLLNSTEGKFITDAFIENPVLIGGKGRLDTEIIKASNGNLFAKVGAEGLCVVVNISKKQALVVKIIDGNMQTRSIVVTESLRQLGWLSEQDLNKEGISEHSDIIIKTWNGIPVSKAEINFSLN